MPLVAVAVLAWTGGTPFAVGAVIILAAVLLAPLAVLFVVMRMVTTVDATHLRLRIHPVGLSLLPRRMTEKDVPLEDISRWAATSYNSATSREFWGWHVWGLSAAKGGRYLYIMRPSGPLTGRGVRVELTNGEILLVGSRDPGALAEVITRAKGVRP